jgi:hypothetical protein
MIEFFKSRMGQIFFESTLPKLVSQLKRIADSLEARVLTPAEMRQLQRLVELAVDRSPTDFGIYMPLGVKLAAMLRQEG